MNDGRSLPESLVGWADRACITLEQNHDLGTSTQQPRHSQCGSTSGTSAISVISGSNTGRRGDPRDDGMG